MLLYIIKRDVARQGRIECAWFAMSASCHQEQSIGSGTTAVTSLTMLCHTEVKVESRGPELIKKKGVLFQEELYLPGIFFPSWTIRRYDCGWVASIRPAAVGIAISPRCGKYRCRPQHPGPESARAYFFCGKQSVLIELHQSDVIAWR